MDLRSVQHEDQTFTYIDRPLVFPDFATDALVALLRKWQLVFPREHTLIQSRHGVPSLFVRFDCVVSRDGEVKIYEIQDGCAWVGYTGIANERFRTIRDDIVREEWPHLKVLRFDEQSDKDDDLWLERVSVDEALETASPLIVRNTLRNLPEEQREIIIAKSLRPVRAHNNKWYGVEFGWWKPVAWHESAQGDALPWNEAFALKPLWGYGSKDIMLWIPQERAGRATRTQILRAFRRHGHMYLQPYIEPMLMHIDDAPYHFIYRPYFIYSGSRGGWIPANGVWTARPYPNMRIHGASDTISGPLFIS